MEASTEEDKNMSSIESEPNEDGSEESDEEDITDDEDGDEDVEGADESTDDDGEAELDAEGDEDGDGEEWDTEEDDDEGDEMLEVSDSDGETGERCPICLNRFREQDIGTPESCDHAFCLECIQEWSKNVNTCPVDRQIFRLILCRHSGENNIYKRLPVEDRNEQGKEEDEEDLTYCEICDECNREDRLLLCDGCDKGYHLDCLTPPLHEVPVEEWFCPGCAQRQVEEEDEAIPQTRSRRQVARTQVMERVRSAIEEQRVRRIRNIRRILSSSEDEEEPSSITETTASTSTTSATKKTPTKKRRRKTPRKYKKRKTKSATTKRRKTRKTTKRRKATKTTKKGKKRRRRKGKKQLARTIKRRVPSTTVKSRIAGALGIETPPTGRTIPTQKSKLDKVMESGAASLSIFGSKEELIHFDDDYSMETAASRGSRYSRSALSSYKPIGRVPIIVPEKKKIVINVTSTATTSSLDLLGSIMHDQSKLHMDSKHVKIQRDGSLIRKEKSSHDEKASTSKFFKSSFTAVQGEMGPSILNSLSHGSESKTEDMKEEYDPAHPTDELDSDVEPVVTHQEDDKYDPAHPTDELDDVSEEEGILQDNDAISATSSVNVLVDTGMTGEGEKTDQVENEKSKSSANAGHSIMEITGTDSNKLCKEKLDGKPSSKKTPEETTPLCKEYTSPTKDKKQASAQKVSPSIKITEITKKVSPIKPFEIPKKSLFEKKKLYGGEIDFSEDVTFNDAGFENFEINIKAIESVFKGTVNTPKEKVNEREKSSEVGKDKEVETNKTDEKLKVSGKENTLKLTGKDNLKNSGKSTPPKSMAEEHEGPKGTLTVNERFSILSNEMKDNDIVTLEEEDPIHEMRKLDKELDLELENPDVGKGKDWPKSKNDSEKEYKKTRRKVSIDRDEEGKVRHRKDAKERKLDVEEVEEGEVEDENQYRERKRREKREKKKKLAAEKERYLNDLEMTFGDLINLPESEIDTRIVVQVSQNTDSRTVWEEDEKIRRKKDKEEKERRRERQREEERSSKKERKRKRHRSRSHSYEKRDKSRERKRSRSRDRSKRRHRDKSRSKSTDRSRKKKKKTRDRSRDKRRSREKSVERVDIFGRSRSPFRRKDSTKERDSVSPVYQTKYSAMKNKRGNFEGSQSKKPRLDGEIILIDDDDDTDDRDKSVHEIEPSDDSNSNTPKQDFEDTTKAESISKVQVKERIQRDVSSDERDEDSEPEETEQFNYTDRDEYLSQNKHKQQHQNLIQIGVDGTSYDPNNPTESSSPIPPPLPDRGYTLTPTPPLPPVGDFAPLFPPPPPGPPPGPPPSSVLIQDRPPVPRILGETSPMLIRGPLHLDRQGPPPLDIQGPPPHEIRGPPPHEIRGPSPHEIRRPPPHEIRRPPPLDIRGPPSLDIRGPPPLDIRGPPPLDIRGPPPHEIQGPPPHEIRGPPPTDIRGPPPLDIREPLPLDQGRPPQGMIHQRPTMSLPMNINVPPQGFHRGLPQTVRPQRQIIVNAFRPSMPGMQRLPGPGGPRFGFNTSSEVMNPTPFSLSSHPRPSIINGPYDGLPPPSDGPPHSHFTLGGELPPPARHLPMHEGPPTSNLVQIDVDEGQIGLPLQTLGPPVTSNSEAQLVHLGQIPVVPLPRLPIPLLPTSDPAPVSVMVSMPPPIMSLPPSDISLSSHLNRSIPSPVHVHAHPSQVTISKEDCFMDTHRATPPSNPVESIFEMSNQSTHVNSNTTVIPGLDMHVKTETKTSSGNSKKTYSQLEEISKLLNTQAKLMLVSNNKCDTNENGPIDKDKGVFKVPLPPVSKCVGSKTEVETTEVIDMDMASPILEEGNIELPVSPQFDNLIDTDDWLEEVYNNKTQKKSEKSEKLDDWDDIPSKAFNSSSWEEDVEEVIPDKKDKSEKWENEVINKTEKESENSERSDNWIEIINTTLEKSVEIIEKASEKLDKLEPKDVKSSKEKGSTTVVKLREHDHEVKKDSPKKRVESKKQEQKEKKTKSHHHRKHKNKPDASKGGNVKQKTEVNVELDLDSQELTSAVDMTNKEKYLRKLHLQERVVEEVKMAIKPHYANKKIDKDQYKEIMRKAVPKICHSKSGDINPQKIKGLVEAYVDRFNKPKQGNNSGSEDVSPTVKSNGERAKTKAVR